MCEEQTETGSHNRSRCEYDAGPSVAGNQTKPDKDGDGAMGKYEKARVALIKKLAELPPEDVEDAAQRTITELQEAMAAMKPAKAA
jgi:hypothetical protein